MEAKPKAYSYLRFSTPEQAAGDSYRRQMNLAEEYAERHSLDLDSSSFQDLGISAYIGANARIGKLGEFLRGVEDGLIPSGSFLLVESLDRISREQIINAQLLFLSIIMAGITIVTLADGKLFSQQSVNANPTDMLLSLLTMMRANEESATKARRIRASWDAKRASAGTRPLTAMCPAWLRLNVDTRTFEIMEDKASVVRRIYEQAMNGVGAHSIAKALNIERVRPFGRASMWHTSYVKKILESQSVAGTFVPHVIEYRNEKKARIAQEPVPNYFPAIVPLEVYSAVRSAQSAPLAVSMRRSSATVRTFVAGLAVCPNCGGTMTRVTKGARSKPYLICARAKQGAGCVYRAVPVAKVEAALVRMMPDLARNIPSGDEGLDEQIEVLELEMGTLDSERENLADALMQTRSRTVQVKLTQRESELADLAERRKVLVERRIASAPFFTGERLAELEALSRNPEPDIPRMNGLMRQLFRGVIVDYDEGDLHLEWHNGGRSSATYEWRD